MPIDPSIRDEVQEAFGIIPTWFENIPQAAQVGFWTTMRDFHLAETKIPNKYKELIGLAVSGATRCRYCTLFHTAGAKVFGATTEEIHEASLMGAWTMMGSTYLNAAQIDYEKFRKETEQIVAHVRKNMAKQAPVRSR